MKAGPDRSTRTRCDWAPSAGLPTPLYRDYHDQEWGRPLRGSIALFERMSLEAFQSGLSWLIILRKRDNFRQAFDGFDIEKVARYNDADVQRLMADAGHRAQPRQDRGHHRQRPRRRRAGRRTCPICCGPSRRHAAARPATLADVPATSPESTAMAKDLKRRGFRFVGPTTAYALMQATGMVDDHLAACWVPAADER